jgi:hypothetical protein
MILAVAAGALAFVNPAKAEAQRFFVGVRVGNPYYAPRYYGYDHYEYARREAFFRHEEWLREHRFDRPYGYR